MPSHFCNCPACGKLSILGATCTCGQRTDLPVKWRHCRWVEPHLAEPRPGTIGPIRAQGGTPGAACITCGEALVPLPTATPTEEAR